MWNILNKVNTNVLLSVAVVVALVVGIYTTVLMTKINSDIVDIRVELENSKNESIILYPLKVLQVGFHNDETESDIINTIKGWKGEDADGRVRGAQLGAMQTVCQIEPTALHTFMGQDTQVKACRLVN